MHRLWGYGGKINMSEVFEKDDRVHINSFTGFTLSQCGLNCIHADKVRNLIKGGFIELQRQPDILYHFSRDELVILEKYALERMKKAEHNFTIAVEKHTLIWFALRKKSK